MQRQIDLKTDKTDFNALSKTVSDLSVKADVEQYRSGNWDIRKYANGFVEMWYYEDTGSLLYNGFGENYSKLLYLSPVWYPVQLIRQGYEEARMILYLVNNDRFVPKEQQTTGVISDGNIDDAGLTSLYGIAVSNQYSVYGGGATNGKYYRTIKRLFVCGMWK